jgi:tetratricopeptide (TPR) repeat protein
MRCTSLWLIAVALSACARPHGVAVTPGPDGSARLAAADRLLRDGCLDCFTAAYREYDALRAMPSSAARAAAGAARAAALVALRERELGMADDGYLLIARGLTADTTDVPGWVRTTLDLVDALGSMTGIGVAPSSDADLERSVRLRQRRQEWTTTLRSFAEVDELAAYSWLSVMCASVESRDVPVDDVFGAASTFQETPLAVFKRATCRTRDRTRLEALLNNDPRFVETTYLLGLMAVGQRRLDEAERLFQRAYDWHPRWPALTQSMAGVAMTAEEFARAAALYDETLAIEPHAVVALLGKIKALTYDGRHEEALETTDELLAERWYVGDARYWRALNEADLERYDEAWGDIEESARTLVNAEVPKLAGIIAYRRGQIEVARLKFEESRARDANDCETGFYLGTVLAEQAVWERSTAVLVDAVACLDRAEQALGEQIAAIRASHDPPDRQARQIARREAQIAASRRMRVTSWFDLAVAYFNLSRAVEARQYAEKVLADDRYGDRAREILSRIR